jgi:hypothetical protein
MILSVRTPKNPSCRYFFFLLFFPFLPNYQLNFLFDSSGRRKGVYKEKKGEERRGTKDFLFQKRHV